MGTKTHTILVCDGCGSEHDCGPNVSYLKSWMRVVVDDGDKEKDFCEQCRSVMLVAVWEPKCRPIIVEYLKTGQVPKGRPKAKAK